MKNSKPFFEKLVLSFRVANYTTSNDVDFDIYDVSRLDRNIW